MKKNLLFVMFLFMVLCIPTNVCGKEIVSVIRHGSGYASVLYDDNTAMVSRKQINSVSQYALNDIKVYLRNINDVYEYLGIDGENKLYTERIDYKSRQILLNNVKRFVEEYPNFSYSNGVFVETYDNKLYLIKDYDENYSDKESIILANGKYAYLMDDSIKEIKYFVDGTIFYTIDDTENLYIIGENIVGDKINDGKYLYERTLVLENVRKIDGNLILTNNNELYLTSSSIARPTLIKTDVEDFVVKSGSLVYIKDILGKSYRIYINVNSEVYIRKMEEINTNNIYQYDDTLTKVYYSSSDSFGYYPYPYLYNEGNVYYDQQLIKSDVVYFDRSFVLTSNGNLYTFGKSDYSLYYSHMEAKVYDELQLIDRNVLKIHRDATGTSDSSLIYEKKDGSLWGFGNTYHDEVLELLNPDIGDGYHLPFCILGDCQNEIILENLNINTVLINQQFDFYANAYPSNADNLDVTWNSSDESIAKVDDTGYVTTLKPGEVTITATVNGQVSDSVKLKVMDDNNVFEIDSNEDFRLKKGVYKEISFNDNLGDYDNEYEITYSDQVYAMIANENIFKVNAYTVGKHTVTLTTKNRKYSKTIEFDAYEDINNLEVNFTNSYKATGEPIEPKIEIEGLVEGKDFTVEYENNVLPSSFGVIKITGIGYYYGTITEKFYISYKGYFSDLTFPKIENQKYTGEEIKPKIEIDGLVENLDYTVTYENNIDVGYADVYIKGVTYSGEKRLRFYISPIDIEYEVKDYEIYYDELEHSIDLNVKTDGVKIEYAVYDDNYSETMPVFKEPGIYTVKFKLSKKNYNVVVGESTIIIKDLMYIEYDGYNYTNVDYDGLEHTIELGISTPDVTVKYMDQNGEYTLDESPKYSDAGEYEIFFQLSKENYHTFTTSKTLVINPLYIDYEINYYSGSYDKKEHTIDIKTNTPDVTIKYGTESGIYNLDEPPKYIYPGKYTIYIQLSKKNYQTIELTGIVDIDHTNIISGYSGYTGMYDGNEHSIGVFINEEYPDATVLFADEFGDYTLTESPKYSEIGQYKINFCVSSPSYYQTIYEEVTLTIMGIKDEYSKDYKLLDDKYDEYLVVNNPNITLDNIKNIFNFFDLKVEYLLNENKDSKDIFKTNDILELRDNPLFHFTDKRYTIAILGEVTGDGKINYLDYVNVYNHIYKNKHPESNKKLLSEAYLVAADISNDGKVNYLDYVKIYNKIKELKGGSN